jgi:signal transduction histidine kinase
MAINIKFPIRYKILAVLSAVVIAAVAVYLYLASRLFYEDKTLLVYELNQNNVRTLASDLEGHLKRVVDKLKLVAVLAPPAGKEVPAEFAAAFAEDDELVRVAILEKTPNAVEPAQTFSKIWPSYLSTYQKDSTYLEQLRRSVPIPFDNISKHGIWVRNATTAEENSPPLFTLAVALESAGAESPTRRVIYADVRLDRILSAFVPGGIAQAYALDSERSILADSEQSRIRSGATLTDDPLVNAALISKVRSEVRRFDERGKSFLGSYYQVGLADVIVASKVETGQAFAAAERLVRKSLIYALVVITAAFLVALFFSHSLTVPIHKMLEATQRVAKGDFNRLIHISSHDELATLARSFNTMTVDLKTSRAQIEEYSHDLERKVQDRTAKLEEQNVAIREAQEALVRTTRLASVGEIAGRAAHEVLNPLTNLTMRLEKMAAVSIKADHEDTNLFKEIVDGWQEDFESGGKARLLETLSSPSRTVPGKTLLDEDLSNLRSIVSDISKRLDERKSDIDFLLREASRINKIVNGMRSLTRVSGNRRPINVREILEEAMSTMKDVLGKHRITTELRHWHEDLSISADHDELIQVFSNMLRNSMQAIDQARKAGTKVGEPAKVWISTEHHNHRVLIRVCDNGPGIRAEDFQNVFAASFTTKTAEEGTGLGLSISRRFIRAFDGEIIVERSVPGVATVFLIDLPELKGQNA